MGNPTEAEDLTQHSFIEAFCGLRSYDHHRSFATWLVCIAICLPAFLPIREFGVSDPFSWVLLWLGVSNVNAEVSQGLGFPGATVTVVDKGDPMPDIPEWTVSLTSDYSWPVSGDWSAFVRADYRYSSRQPVDFAASSYRQDVNLANLRVGMSDDQWEVALFANNVFDQAPSLGPFTFGSAAGGGFRPFDYTIRPRTLGVRVARNF